MGLRRKPAASSPGDAARPIDKVLVSRSDLDLVLNPAAAASSLEVRAARRRLLHSLELDAICGRAA